MHVVESQERRGFPRTNARLMVAFRIGKGLERFYAIGKSVNVGQGGMLLHTARSFDLGLRLDMQVRFPFSPAATPVAAEIIASREIVEDVLYSTRIRFLGLDPCFCQELAAFVEERRAQV